MKLLILCFFFTLQAFATIETLFLDSHKTLYIVDGDSISMQMRIQGIDTPEMTQTCEKIPGQIIDCGHLAKQHLHHLLKTLPGKLRIEPQGIDPYQRILVSVYKGDVDVGKLMVEQGMAYSHKDTYKKQQQYAQTNKFGFWGFYKPPIKPYEWRKRHLSFFK